MAAFEISAVKEFTGNSTSDAQAWAGGVGTFRARPGAAGFGVMGKVTLQFEDSEDAGEWHEVSAATQMSGKNAVNFQIGACNLRVVVSGVETGEIVSIYCGVF